MLVLLGQSDTPTGRQSPARLIRVNSLPSVMIQVFEPARTSIYNKILVEENIALAEGVRFNRQALSSFADLSDRVNRDLKMKKYLTEKNALTVMVALFSLIMMFKAFVIKQSMWEAIAFALAFSMSVEVICHRAKERN